MKFVALTFIHAIIVMCSCAAFAQLPADPDAMRGDSLAIRSSENPNGRADFEWLRLRDPATGLIPERMREKELLFSAMLPRREEFSDESSAFAHTLTASPSWVDRGPRNIGGRTRAFGVDISNRRVLVAGGVSGSMYRSGDSGMTWARTSLPNALHNATCLAQDPRNGHTNTWYCGTGEFIGNSASLPGSAFAGNGLFKSTDDGVSWNPIPSTLSNIAQGFDYVFSVAVNPANAGQSEIYVAGRGTIVRSLDGGDSWTTVKGNITSSKETQVTVTSRGVVYATLSNGGPDAGIWRSADGNNWVNITPVGWPANNNLTAIGVAPSNPDIVYFFSSSGQQNTPDVLNFWRYTFLSGDGSGSGGMWEDRSSALASDIESYDGYCLAVAVKPTDPNTVFIGATDLYRSTNGFSSSAFTSLWHDVPHVDHHVLAFAPHDDNTLYDANDGGVWVSHDATDILSTSWSPVNSGYETTQFYTCALDHTTTDPIVIGGLQDNGTVWTNSSNANDDWASLLDGDGGFCMIADSAINYFVSYQDGNIFRMNVGPDGGVQGTSMLTPRGSSGYLRLNPFALDPLDQNVMYLPAGNVFWRNSDLRGIPSPNLSNPSINWTKLPSTLVDSAALICAITPTKTPAHRLYYGTTRGRIFRIDNANVGAPVPVDLSQGKGMPPGFVSCIAVDPLNGDSAIVVFSNYNVQSIYLTTDAGTTWSAEGGNLEQDSTGIGNGPSCRWVTIVPVGAGRVFLAATSTGMYSTTSLNGRNTVWTLEAPSLVGNQVVEMFDARMTDNVVVAATHGAGMVSTKFSSLPTGAPLLASPTNSATDIAIDTQLVWNAVTNATSYRLQIATDAAFTSVKVDSAIGDKLEFIPTGLQRNTLYYWRALAADASGSGAWSAVWRFTTTSINGVEAAHVVAHGYSLEPIAPNPADEIITAAFTLPNRSDVFVSLCDALGRNIQTNVIGFTDAGTHNIALHIGSLVPGVYFCRVNAGSVVMTRQFSVVR